MGSGSDLPVWFLGWGVFAAVVLGAIWRSLRRDRAAQRAAIALGLTFEDTRTGGRVFGKSAGFDVEAVYTSSGARVDVRGVSRDVEIRRRERFEGDSWLKTGDAQFDKHVHLNGDRGQVLALLDYDTRQVLQRLLADEELRVEAGGLVLASGKYLDDAGLARERQRKAAGGRAKPGDLHQMLSAAIAAASYVATPEEPIDELLAENAIRDFDSRVRLRNLLCLQEDYPSSPHTARAIAACLEDSDNELRVCAAWGVPAEKSVEIAREIVRARRVAGGLRRQALALLTERLPREDAMAAAIDALADDDARVRAEAIRRLAWLGARHAAKAIAGCRKSRNL
ncbi:MAG TPA: hypothetical protein VMV18_07925, partial [bacterium]|nr:hypothetical protein [bacterium]